LQTNSTKISFGEKPEILGPARPDLDLNENMAEGRNKAPTISFGEGTLTDNIFLNDWYGICHIINHTLTEVRGR